MVTNLDLNSELTNDVVTISKLQIGLRAEARSLQAQLTEFASTADTTTSEGLFQLLQQTATVLLNHDSFWTHVLASSQTVYSREAAETLFGQISIQERQKFSAETLTNVDGVIQKQELPPASPGQPAYIVVTLLLGTADDQPLFGEIYTTSVLRDVLQNITAMRSSFLMVLELLWSPQAATDSLTEAELAIEYGDLVAIA